MSFNGGGAPAWAMIVGILSVGMSLLWLYIAWRAMKAHERLASAAEKMARSSGQTSAPL